MRQTYLTLSSTSPRATGSRHGMQWHPHLQFFLNDSKDVSGFDAEVSPRLSS